MATYTGVADGNGDFTIPFSQNYVGGQKVTVKASKDGAEKTIELYAPSEAVSSNVGVLVSGSYIDFPLNCGDITLVGFKGAIQANAFRPTNAGEGFSRSTGLTIKEGVTSIGNAAFLTFSNLKFISLPDSLLTIGSSSFERCTAVKKLEFGLSIKSIGGWAFDSLTNCDEIIIKNPTPPTIASTTFGGLKSTCVIKVPSASLATYKAAPAWSAHASKMVGF